MIFGMPGKERPCACVLKLRLNHPPESERLGNSPERVWRTRADAASVRKPAMTTDGGADCVFPVAWRTASANDKRRGAGACARTEPAKISAKISAIGGLLADTMEIEIDVSVEVFGDVEAFGHAGRERGARHNGVHQGGHGELGRDGNVDRPEFAGFDPALQYAPHQTMTAGDDFLVVEAGELREIAGFGNHQAGNSRERRLAHQPEILAHQLFEEIPRATGEGLGEGLALLDDGDDRLADQRLEQRFFVFEVEVDRALGDAGATGDIFELRGREPAVGKDFERRGDDLLGPSVLATAPTGFCDCLRHYGLQVTN